MAADEKDPRGLETDPTVPQSPIAAEETTGRMSQVPIAVSVPSVVSKSKPKSAPVENISSSDAAPSASDQQTGRIASLGQPEDSAQEALDSLYATGQNAPVPSSAYFVQPINSQSLSDRVSGNITGNSANIGVIDQKSIDLRKEQIQRVKKRESDKRKQRISRIVRRAIAIVLIVLILGAIGAFSFFRWGMHDDYADLQGTWVIEGSNNAKVKISEDKITLNKEVSYSYELDPTSKTLTFDFGQLSGNGRYRFSVDRNQLSLQDGEFEMTQTLSDDIPWSLQAIWDYLATSTVDSPNLGEGSITLNRVVEE